MNPAYGCAASSCAYCNVPHAVPTCVQGACSIGACDAQRADCNASAADGCETDTNSDPAHCGSCATVCTSGAACTNGQCVTLCNGAPCVNDASVDQKVAANGRYSCAVKADGTLVCWGENFSFNSTAFRQVSAGNSHVCGVKADGTIACWENNSHGEANVPAGFVAGE